MCLSNKCFNCIQHICCVTDVRPSQDHWILRICNQQINLVHWIPKNKQMSLFRFLSSPGEGTMLAAKRSAGVAPKENFREHVTCTPPSSANKAVNAGFCILFYYVFSFQNLEISLILCEWKGLSCFCLERLLLNIRTY